MPPRLLVGFALFALACARSVCAEPVALTVMTYNVRFASETPPNAWPARRPLLRDVIRRAAPDVLGTQEGLYPQLKDMASDLPGYAWIGLGREGGSRGEFMAVFYRTDRLEPVAFDHFWLSDTPEVIGSATWGNRYKRMVTWVRFRLRGSGVEFTFWNTHFDHEVPLAREKSARLLRQRIAEAAGDPPVVLAGDFNAAAGGDAAYSLLTDGDFLQDAWLKAQRRSGEGFGTFHDFGKTPKGGARIDWILFRGPWECGSIGIVTERTGELYPSDHYPVVAHLRLR